MFFQKLLIYLGAQRYTPGGFFLICGSCGAKWEWTIRQTLRSKHYHCDDCVSFWERLNFDVKPIKS